MKKLVGVVTSVKMANTAVVQVERGKTHPLYGKTIKQTKNYSTQDNLGVKLGQIVIIGETRPISKTKKWQILEIKK